MLDIFIDTQRRTYYKNIQLQIQVKILQLQNELKNIDNNEIFNIRDKENKLKVLKSKLEKLIDTFISSLETMQSVIEKKIKELEIQINKIELEIFKSKSIAFNKEKHIREINNKIAKLKD